MGIDMEMGSNNGTYHILPRLIRVFDFEASYPILKEELLWVKFCAKIRNGGVN